MAITWLADVLRDAGLTVVEHSGWKARTVGGIWEPRFGIVHATAAPRSQDDDVQVRVVRDGREDLRGPIANACVDRSGRWHVLAAGRCNTTLAGTAGPYEGQGNTHALGVEACNDNRDEPWPAVQYDSYVRGWAAIAKRLGWSPDRLRGHKEHTPGRKTDPTFSMSRFRTDVQTTLEEDDMPSADEIAQRTVEKLFARPVPAPKGTPQSSFGWAIFQIWHRTGHIGNVALPALSRVLDKAAETIATLAHTEGTTDAASAALAAETLAAVEQARTDLAAVRAVLEAAEGQEVPIEPAAAAGS